MSAAAADAWLSVLVKCGHKLVRPRQVVKYDWGETFAMLLDKPELVIISTKYFESEPQQLMDPQQPLDPQAGKDAADVLMAAYRRIVLHPAQTPPEGKELRRDQKLYNDLLGKR